MVYTSNNSCDSYIYSDPPPQNISFILQKRKTESILDLSVVGLYII